MNVIVILVRVYLNCISKHPHSLYSLYLIILPSRQAHRFYEYKIFMQDFRKIILDKAQQHPGVSDSRKEMDTSILHMAQQLQKKKRGCCI